MRNFLIHPLVTDMEHALHTHLPSAFDHFVLPVSGRHNAIVCLERWRDSSSYDVLSRLVVAALQFEVHLTVLELEAQSG